MWRNIAFVVLGIAIAGWVGLFGYKAKWEAAQARKSTVIYKTDTLATRPDTIEVAPPALLAKISALGGRPAVFLADTARNADTCFALLTQALIAWDSLGAALAVPPAIRLGLADTSLPYLRVGVRYLALRGDTAAKADWVYTQVWSRWPLPPGYQAPGMQRFFGLAAGFDGKDALAGVRLRLGKNFILGATRNLDKKTWGGEAAYFIF